MPARTRESGWTTRSGDPADLSSYLGRPDLTAAWMRRGNGLVGLGVAWRRSFASAMAADSWWAALVAQWSTDDTLVPPPPDSASRPLGSSADAERRWHAAMGPVAFVSFPCDDGHTTARYEVVVPAVVIGRRDKLGWVTTWDVGDDVDDGDPERNVSFVATDTEPDGVTSCPPETNGGQQVGEGGSLEPTPPSYRPGALTKIQWTAAVVEAIRHIRDGQLDKVVLARDEIATLARPMSTGRLVSRLHTAYPETWTFAVDGLVGATPELLVRRDRGLVTSRVLAGTIRRHGGSDAEDLEEALATSSKDLAEHEYAVASVAEALAPYCSAMNVPETPFVLRLPNVMHLASDIAGVCGSDASVVHLAAAVHPSAAICGTPTARARTLIRELEGLDRGRYAGPVGWIGASGDGEIALALRCGQLRPDGLEVQLFAGCGIVADSDPGAELSETEAKLLPMKQALGL